MKILEGEGELDFITLHVESDDDLWYLHNIISPGDMVKMTVMRRLEKQQDMTRAKEVPRKPVTLTIKVESIEFQEFSGTLRTLGTVISGSEDAIGQHQSFAISPGDTFMLSKARWSDQQNKLFRESIENRFSEKYYFVVIDDETAFIESLKSYGIQSLGKIDSHKTGKHYSSDYSEDKYLREVYDALARIIPEGSSVIVLGSGFTRDKFVLLAKSFQSKFAFITFPTARSDEGAIWEFLNSPESDGILKDFRLSGDTRLVEEFLKRLKTSEDATYGFEAVKRAIEVGAVEVLIVSEEKFRTEQGREILELAENFGTSVHIISLTGEKGNIVKNFGGYCALLRYKIQQ